MNIAWDVPQCTRIDENISVGQKRRLEEEKKIANVRDVTLCNFSSAKLRDLECEHVNKVFGNFERGAILM